MAWRVATLSGSFPREIVEAVSMKNSWDQVNEMRRRARAVTETAGMKWNLFRATKKPSGESIDADDYTVTPIPGDLAP